MMQRVHAAMSAFVEAHPGITATAKREGGTIEVMFEQASPSMFGCVMFYEETDADGIKAQFDAVIEAIRTHVPPSTVFANAKVISRSALHLHVRIPVEATKGAHIGMIAEVHGQYGRVMLVDGDTGEVHLKPCPRPRG